jgi:hypothetical protein
MHCIEISGRGFEYARVNLFGVTETAVPMQRERLLQGLAGIERAGLHGGAIAWHRREVNQRS